MSLNSKRNDLLANAMTIAMVHLASHPDLPATSMINTIWQPSDEVAALDIHIDYHGGYAAFVAWASSVGLPAATARKCPQGSTELAVNLLAMEYPIKVWMHLSRGQRNLLWANLPSGEPERGETVEVPMTLLHKLAAAEAAIAETLTAATAPKTAATP